MLSIELMILWNAAGAMFSPNGMTVSLKGPSCKEIYFWWLKMNLKESIYFTSWYAARYDIWDRNCQKAPSWKWQCLIQDRYYQIWMCQIWVYTSQKINFAAIPIWSWSHGSSNYGLTITKRDHVMTRNGHWQLWTWKNIFTYFLF